MGSRTCYDIALQIIIGEYFVVTTIKGGTYCAIVNGDGRNFGVKRPKCSHVT